jgi:hypothetical protein
MKRISINLEKTLTSKIKSLFHLNIKHIRSRFGILSGSDDYKFREEMVTFLNNLVRRDSLERFKHWSCAIK